MQYLGYAAAGVFMLGWIIPLAIGIVQLRRRRAPAGIILTVVGALWAVPAVAALVTAGAFYFGYGPSFGTHTFDPARHLGPRATIIIPWQGKGTLEFRWRSRQYLSESDNGQFAVPAGSLPLTNFTAYSSPDKTGWQARSTFDQRSQLSLAANEQHALAAGPPYTAQVKVQEAAGKAYMSMDIKDAGGNVAGISDVARKSPPHFDVLDKAGKVVWQGKFEYG